MFSFSINQRSKGAISSVRALFRVVDAMERLRCFEGSMNFGMDINALLRKWLGVTPCSFWLEDGAQEICIIFSTKCSSQWEEQRLYVDREGELSSPSLSDEELDELKYGLGQLFK